MKKIFEQFLREGASALSTVGKYFGAKMEEQQKKEIQEQQQLAAQSQRQFILANADCLAENLHVAFHDRDYCGVVVVREVQNLRFRKFRRIKGKGVYVYTILKTQKSVLSPSELSTICRMMNEDIEWMRQNLCNSFSQNEMRYFYPFYARGMQVINVKDTDDYFSIQIAVAVS